ncbi:MAG TPA: sugar ABC transporter permease [Alphaproteobacteria bacterium]|nr:sugar ABC transporter permease [Alphaproteobacteria bacterium]
MAGGTAVRRPVAVPGATPGPFRRAASAALEPYLYLSPALILLALVMFVPLVIGISYAFRSLNLANPFATGFVGLENFARLAGDANFRRSLVNTVWWTGGSLVFQFFLGLGLALLLNRAFPGRRLVQALVFLPWAVPTFLSGLTWAWLLNPVIGPLPHWMAALGILSEPYNILSNPDVALWGPIAANVWFGVPFFAITLLAALQAIPHELYEAAAIDGATPWQRFTRITLPFLAPTIAITVLLRTIWIANFADLIWVMTNGGPANSTQIVATYIFSTAYSRLDFGYASAVATVLLALLMLYAAILIRMRRSLLRRR